MHRAAVAVADYNNENRPKNQES